MEIVSWLAREIYTKVLYWKLCKTDCRQFIKSDLQARFILGIRWLEKMYFVFLVLCLVEWHHMCGRVHRALSHVILCTMTSEFPYGNSHPSRFPTVVFVYHSYRHCYRNIASEQNFHEIFPHNHWLILPLCLPNKLDFGPT